MTTDDKISHKERVRSALNKFLSNPTCPICGKQYWRGGIHIYGEIYYRKPTPDTIWCDGKKTWKNKLEKKAD